MTKKTGFLQRLALAWRILFDAAFASSIAEIQDEQLGTKPNKALANNQSVDDKQTATTTKPNEKQAGAAQLLTLLQREGRFVDFISEDISSFADAEVGAAARAVHQGCAKVFRQHLQLAAIRSEDEAAQIDVPVGFDSARLSLSGQVQGAPPYKGRLLHPGWELHEITLPSRQGASQNLFVIAPAEVEI